MQIPFQLVSDLYGPDRPAVIPLISDTGKQRHAVLGSGGQQGVVRFADFVHTGDGVGAGALLGGQGDAVAGFQRVDLSEDGVGPPVMRREAGVSVPNAGVLKMARAFRQDGAARALVDLDIYIQAGDFQNGQIAAL